MFRPALPASATVFVYYRVQPERVEAALDGVRHLFRALCEAWPGLSARLMAKVDAAAEATWMEVYAHPQGLDAGFVDRMQDLAHALLADQTGLRHVEVFAPLPVEAQDGLA